MSINKKVILCILVLFFIVLSVDHSYCDYYNRKDPLLSGVLSWYMPGLGQFYCEKYVKGSIFWLIENTLFISTILTVADINFSVNKDIGFQFSIKPKETISRKEETIGITLAVSFVLFHIYNVIDAVQTAKNVNSDNAEKMRSARFNFDYKQVADNNYYMMNYKF